MVSAMRICDAVMAACGQGCSKRTMKMTNPATNRDNLGPPSASAWPRSPWFGIVAPQSHSHGRWFSRHDLALLAAKNTPGACQRRRTSLDHDRRASAIDRLLKPCQTTSDLYSLNTKKRARIPDHDMLALCFSTQVDACCSLRARPQLIEGWRVEESSTAARLFSKRSEFHYVHGR